jgi:hypothetical protein
MDEQRVRDLTAMMDDGYFEVVSMTMQHARAAAEHALNRLREARRWELSKAQEFDAVSGSQRKSVLAEARAEREEAERAARIAGQWYETLLGEYRQYHSRRNQLALVGPHEGAGG